MVIALRWLLQVGMMLSVVKLAASGVDPSFDPGLGADALVYAFGLQQDGRVVVGGAFTSFAGTNIQSIARLTQDGQVDPSFRAGRGANNRVMTMGIQPDNKIIVAGEFTALNDIPRNRIARLNANGSVDTSFDPGIGSSDPILNYNFIYSVAVQTDGKILVGGTFTYFNGKPANRIVRLNPDGSEDATFNVGKGAEDHWVGTICLQKDGKILLGGWFTQFNGIGRQRVVRLNRDGTVDTSFHADVNSSVYSLAVQDDGKILIAGHFTAINGLTRNRIARLESDGTVDSSFNPPGGANDWVQAIRSLNDGRILVAGYFSLVNGVSRSRLARLNDDGSLDGSFSPQTDDYVYTVLEQPDGKLLIGGGFATVDSIPRPHVARLIVDSSPRTTFQEPRRTQGNFTMKVFAQSGYNYGIEFCSGLSAQWQALSQIRGDDELHIVSDRVRSVQRFYRCRVETIGP